MFFFFNNSDKMRLKLKDARTGCLSLGDFGNVDCATIDVNGRVLRLITRVSFFRIIGFGG